MRRLFITLSALLFLIMSGLFIFGTNHDLKNFEIIQEATAADEPLKAGMIDPKTGKNIKYWAAPMDPSYIRNEPGQSPMGMDLVPVYGEAGGEKEATSTIRIDPVTVQNMGLRLGEVSKKHLIKEIRTFGNITYNETGIHTVNTKFSGWIEKLYADFVGVQVKKGRPLFEIYSPELVSAQEEYLLALQQYRKLSDSAYPTIQESAKRLRNASRTRLKYWDLNDRQIQRLEESGKASKTMVIYSPASGVIVKKNAFAGQFVKAGEHQFEIADLSDVWVDVHVYEYELPWVKDNMPAEMELAYVPGKKFSGQVLYIYPYLEPRTRTAKLRLSFPNQDGQLKPGMYANIYLQSVTETEALVIPQDAVINSGVRKVVFVSLGKGKFEPREVILGLEGNQNEFQVLEGLKEGEQIVVSAQFMLDSESRLREAIQKMLDVKQGTAGDEDDDLDMSDMTMDDDLDMTDLTMGE
ncbi:MAG: efflux RND transporter periplasmic adaptor subunit [Desulfobacterales bacterium]|nr:efflux RND transporter periplasmic adaptor subunit [Desulfobacterales bacterium]